MELHPALHPQPLLLLRLCLRRAARPGALPALSGRGARVRPGLPRAARGRRQRGARRAAPPARRKRGRPGVLGPRLRGHRVAACGAARDDGTGTFLTHPSVAGPASGGFAIAPYALAVLSAPLLSSLTVCQVVTRGLVSRRRLATITAWCDVLFGAAIVVFTEGTSSPFWAFFVFAVFAAGTHGGFRRSMAVTTVSVGAYLSLILVAWHGQANFYIMRPVYLAVVGYLTAYLGQQRLSLQAQVHQLRAARERNRIARALHDGCVQTLAGINLTLESCQELLRADRGDEALRTLAG